MSAPLVPAPRLHVFLGTKAQYNKTAPLLRLLDANGVDYHLIDSGQHAALSVGMRLDLGVRPPDVVLGSGRDITTVGAAAIWSARLAARLVRRRRLRAELFGGAAGGLCVVHGDTPSTLLATLLARRAGLQVAHLEAGLRSHSLLHPFPEELIRLVVMRLSSLLFAPDATAVANLAAMGVKGRVVALEANTSMEAVAHALPGGQGGPGRHSAAGERDGGPAIVMLHRVENLHRAAAVAGFVDVVRRVAAAHPVRFVVHGPTAEVLRKRGHDKALVAAGVELVPLVAHTEFVAMLAAAPLVVTDGGSVQEECALLGVPTLLWRARTERPDGLDANVVLARYDPAVVDAFLADPARWRRTPTPTGARPSTQILAELLTELTP
ncbi:UDP-N-acetylglucosamine 2-epimerase (non-hydrolyzing) [soil metagenome]